MRRKIHDITFAVSEEMPSWPGTPAFEKAFDLRIPADVANSSTLKINSHLGTHIDAPFHFCAEGQTIDEIPLERFMGEVTVRSILGKNRISAEDLEELVLPADCKRLLLKTDNAELWKTAHSFYEDFVALEESAAEWLVQHGFEMIGIDYLSIQKYSDGPEVHQILLESEVLILESLNLTEVGEDDYEIICFPLKIKGAEAAPARIVLIEK